MFTAKTPITHIPAGYMPELDRLPPSPDRGCLRVIGIVVVGALAVVVICGGSVFLASSASRPATLTLAPTATPSPSPVIPSPDAWAITGTALAVSDATPTLDYCWFLTPQPTATPTALPITPDAWAAHGTAMALETGTPPQRLPYTSPAPRMV